MENLEDQGVSKKIDKIKILSKVFDFLECPDVWKVNDQARLRQS